MTLNLKDFRVKLRGFAEIILRLVNILSAVMFGSSTVIYVANGIVMRYILRAPVAWADEYCIYIMVLMTYFMQSRLEFYDQGIGVGFIDSFLSKSKALRIFVTLFNGAAVAFVYVVLLNVGYTVVRQQIRFGTRFPIIRLPMAIYFGLINVCFVLVLAFWVIKLFTHDYGVGEADHE